MAPEIRVIKDAAAFGGIAPEWNGLVERATHRDCFHRHEWFATWLAHLAPAGAEPAVVTLHRDGRMVAAAPLQIVPQRKRGLTLRVLQFLQSGITPRSALLVEDDELCLPLLEAVDGLGGWQLAELKAIELESPTTRALVAALRSRGPVVAEAGMVSPWEEIPDNWDEYYEARTNKIRQRFRSAVNRCHQQKQVEVLRLDTYADLEPHFDELLAVSAKSWKGAEGYDMATVGQVAAFYRDYSRRTDGQEAWIAYLLRLDGVPAAFMYLLRDGGHWVALRSDYDEDFSYFMPGVLLHKEVVTELAAQPAPRIYDLVGFSTHFKRNLARQGRRLCDVTFGAPGLAGRGLMGLKTALAGRSGTPHLDIGQVIAGTVPRGAEEEPA